MCEFVSESFTHLLQLLDCTQDINLLKVMLVMAKMIILVSTRVTVITIIH